VEGDAIDRQITTGTRMQKIKDILEIGGKALIGVAGLCYVLGLIVVTIHLRRYGLNSLSLSQLHYVTAGVWVLLPIFALVLFITLAFYVGYSSWEDWRAKSRLRQLANIVWFLASLFILYYVIASYFAGYLGILLGWTNWLFIPLLGVLASFCLAATVVMLINDAAQPQERSIMITMASGVSTIFLVCCYVVLFAANTYRDVPWATGGGMPSTVHLTVESDTKPYLENVGISFPQGSNTTSSIQLLLITETDYIVINANGVAISLPSGLVKTVWYEK
jgi:hypothetical protein